MTTISSFTQTPPLQQTSSAERVETMNLSAIELDNQLVEAFENLDLNRAAELVKMGANPDQKVTLNFKLVLEFLKLHLFGEAADSPKMDWDEVLTQLEAEGNLEDFVNDFFNGEASHPALFLSLILKDENLAITLLENHATQIIELEEPKDYQVNALQMAAGMGTPKVVEHLLTHSPFLSHKPQTEGDLSPIEIALSSNAFEVFKVFVECRKNEVMQLLIENEGVRKALTESQDEGVLPYRELLIANGFPIA